MFSTYLRKEKAIVPQNLVVNRKVKLPQRLRHIFEYNVIFYSFHLKLLFALTKVNASYILKHRKGIGSILNFPKFHSRI